MNPGARPRRNPATAHRTIDGEAVVVLPARMELRILSASASRIWELLDGERTVEDIARTVAEEFEVPPDTALADAHVFLDELRRLELILVDEG